MKNEPISGKQNFVLATNNLNGLNAIKVLKNFSWFRLELLIVHPSSKSKYLDSIIKESNLSNEKIITWDKKKKNEIESKIQKLSSTNYLLSVNFAYIIPESILSLFDSCINLHTGYLPWNKGMHPNVWPFIDGSPAGVTLHIMTPELDAGPIIARRKAEIHETDNARSLYEKLEKESMILLKDELPRFVNGEIKPFFPKEKGSYHTHKDFLSLFKIDINKTYKGKDFINLLRALTFPPYKNAYYLNKDGEKIFVDINLSKDEDN